MEADAPGVLLPCAICARTFMPRSLEKHIKICERATIKKRKPFDSAKQRIQGTDLAEFLPRQEKKRNFNEEKPKSSWKETHNDFLRTIRAARGRTSDTDGQVEHRQYSSHASTGAPTRANEKGACPTCNRRFGVKAYERHVAWCKERSTRLPNNMPATNNVAKERLEARMKYRAPTLKNRRASNREKYSQGSASAPNIGAGIGKTSVPTIESIRGVPSRSTLSGTRKTVSVGDARRSDKFESQGSTAIVTGRGEPSAHASNSTEAAERINPTKRFLHPMKRPTSASSSIGLPAPRNLRLALCVSLNRKTENEAETLGDDPVQSPTYPYDGGKVRPRHAEGKTAIEVHGPNGVDRPVECPNIERKPQSTRFARPRKPANSSFTARTRSELKVNDVTVNENVLGMLVRPCNIIYKDDRLMTWERINRDKVECRSSSGGIKNDARKNESYSSIEEETPPCDLDVLPSSPVEDPIGNNVAWFSAVRKLNRTYLIKDSMDHDAIDDRSYTPIRHSPRIEFHLTKSTSLDRRCDSLSHDEDNPTCGIIENSDNCDVSALHETTDATLEEREFSFHDSGSLRSEASSSGGKCKNLSRDGSPPATKSEICLSENVLCKCKYENEEETNGKRQELSEDSWKSSLEYRTTSETRELESSRKIIDLECTEVPLSRHSHTTKIESNLCNVRDAPAEVSSQSMMKAHERSSPDISSDTTSEKEKLRKGEDNSCLVEYSDDNGSRYDGEYVDRIDITVEKACETVHKTNAKGSANCENDGVKEIILKSVNAEEMERCIEVTEFIAPSDSHVTLERPLPIPIKPIQRLNLIRMDGKIQRKMNLLRGSTDTLISSVEAFDLTNDKRSIELHRHSSEEESASDLHWHNIYENARILPAIKAKHTDATFFRQRSTKKGARSYWEKASKFSNDRSNDNLPTHDYRHNRLCKRNPKIGILPPVLIDQSPGIQSGTCKEYDPFLLAERQMHDLLSDSSDLSPKTTTTERAAAVAAAAATKEEGGFFDRARKEPTKRRDSLYPLSHSSAFVEYPSHNRISSTGLEKRSAIAVVPGDGAGEYDELASDFSSDSTETNSLSREIFLQDFRDTKGRIREKEDSRHDKIQSDSSKKELGRRMILDKSIVLGNEVVVQEGHSNRAGRRLAKEARLKPSMPSRAVQPIRAYSAPKSIYERKSKTTGGVRNGESSKIEKRDRSNGPPILDNDRKNDYITLSSSDLTISPSSIVSSEVDIKRSNSVFDELMTSFEDDDLGNDSFPSLRSILRNESLRAYESSNGPSTRQQHDERISDEESPSLDNYKQQEQKFNADSAYSSLNRKSNYSNHGRSTNDGSNLLEDDSSRNNRRENQAMPISAGKTKCRMSRFCHECGSRFPETAKFCCQCGIKRLAL